MKLSNIELGTAGFLCLLVGCGGNTPMSVGAKDGRCTAGGGCDPGLICVSGQCASPADSAIGPSGSGAGGSGGASGSGGADGNTGAGGQGGDDGRYGLGGDGGSNIGETGGSVPVGFCTGIPRACSLYGDESACEVVGCSWSDLSPIPTCDGMGSTCTTLGTDSCALAGCTWHLGTPPDAALGGGPGAGGAAGRGSGGSSGGGGTSVNGGTSGNGGATGAGGSMGSGGSSAKGGSGGGGSGGTQSNGGSASQGGNSGTGGSTAGGTASNGCSCAVGGHARRSVPRMAALLLAALGLVFRPRRRTRRAEMG